MSGIELAVLGTHDAFSDAALGVVCVVCREAQPTERPWLASSSFFFRERGSSTIVHHDARHRPYQPASSPSGPTSSAR